MSEQHAPTPSKVAVIGGGSIGVAFALQFARSGHTVHVVDPDPERLAAIPGEVESRLALLADHGLFTGEAATVLARIHLFDSVADGVRDVALVQESIPEVLEVKREMFAELEAHAPREALLISSSSALTATEIAADLPTRDRCLIGHPGNPPYLIPVIEIVPAEFTSPAAIEATRSFYEEAGLSPVLVKEEITGFVFNRLQGALLREAYCLVRDGIASVDDVDRVVRDGLGRRWSFMGPFETADLNIRGGIAEHARRMADSYARMGALRGQDDPWTEELVAQVTAERRELLPLEKWEERVAWRDDRLMRLLKAYQDEERPQ